MFKSILYYPLLMLEKIVLITAGGHISSFHAGIQAMHKRLEEKTRGKFELWGARGGITGFNKGDLIPINYKDIDENKAGSMIGVDREHLHISNAMDIIKNQNVYAVVMMGGDNHLGEAAKGFSAGLPFVGWPKTMDGDISTLISIGYETAVTGATTFTKMHYNTAMTSQRVFYVVTFGRDTDWISCGISAYADVMSIGAEKSYSWDFIKEKIKEDIEKNKKDYDIPFSVIHVSEGAKINEMKDPPKEHQKIDKHGEIKLQPKWVALELERLSETSDLKPASQVYEYILRDLPPTETDKKIARMAGKECIDAVLDKNFGMCPAFELEDDFYKVVRKPLEEVTKKRRVKDTDYFDYQNLRTRSSYLEFYGNLFKDSLGKPATRDQLVYKNMIK